MRKANVSATDAGMQLFQTLARKANLTPAQQEAFAAAVLEHQADFEDVIAGQQAPEVDTEVERAKLGPDAQAIITRVLKWGENEVREGRMSPEEWDDHVANGQTAADVLELDRRRQAHEDAQKAEREAASMKPVADLRATGERNPDKEAALRKNPRIAKEELYAAVGSERYARDPIFRAEIDAGFERVFGNEEAGRSDNSLGLGASESLGGAPSVDPSIVDRSTSYNPGGLPSGHPRGRSRPLSDLEE